MAIHPTAVVDPRATLGADVQIGPFAYVGPDVVLHDHVELLPHAVVMGPTELGEGCRVFPTAVVGAEPQDAKYRGQPTRLEVGPGTVFREGATAHRGSVGGPGATRIGARCLFLAQSHVAHDCVVGDGVVFANSAAIAGHSSVGDFAVLGGLVGVHQHARVGRYVMVGAGAMVAQDIPPFMLAQGDRARLFGLNVVGLRRAGFGPEALQELRRGFKHLFASGLPLGDAIATLDPIRGPEVAELIAFIQASRRGVARATASFVE